MPKKYVIILVVGILITGTLGIASLFPGALIEITPEEGNLPFGSGEILKDAEAITGAAIGLIESKADAKLSIDEINVKQGSLEPLQITVENTGEEEIIPNIKISVYNYKILKICSDMEGLDIISPGDVISAESIVDCEFEKPGKYTMNIAIIDQNFNILDSLEREFVIQEICELSS